MTPPPRTDYRGERCPVESNGFLCTLTYRHPLACDFGPLYKPPAPPRDPLVGWAEKIATAVAIANPLGQRATEVILPILRAFVEQMNRDHNALLVDGARWQTRAEQAEASLDEERRLRATACKLADERERERDEAHRLAEIRLNSKNLLWHERDTARAERDRAQERLREAEWLLRKLQNARDTLALARINDKPMRGLLEAVKAASDDVRVYLYRAEQDEARMDAMEDGAAGSTPTAPDGGTSLAGDSIAHPDEQPAAPAGEPLPTDLDRACPDHPFAMLRYCACGTATTERLKAKVRAVGGAEAYRRICNFVNEPAPPAPRTEAPPSEHVCTYECAGNYCDGPPMPERHAFVRHEYEPCPLGEGNCLNRGCHHVPGHAAPCGKPASDPCHAEEDVWERFVREKHADPVHQAAEHECGIVGPHERDDYCPPDTRPDEREARGPEDTLREAHRLLDDYVVPSGHIFQRIHDLAGRCCKQYVECEHDEGTYPLPCDTPAPSSSPSEEAEKCGLCGTRYLNVWRADDETWVAVTGRRDGGGLRCLTCFEAGATLRHITLYWECAANRFPTETIGRERDVFLGELQNERLDHQAASEVGAESLARIKEQDALLEECESALRVILRSAMPRPVEHPARASAWVVGEGVLAKLRDRRQP